MARPDFRFAFRRRVRYAQVDAQAVVYFSHYLEWADVGVVEYWRAAGLYEDAPVAGGGAEFHVVRAEVDYRAPLLLDEEIDICVATKAIGNSSMTMVVELHGCRSDGDGEDLRARIGLVQVHVAEARGRPTRVPDGIADRIERLEGRTLRKETART
ncbi:MAG: acyl-CoA thioesterase [Thermaurantiacus sp.]